MTASAMIELELERVETRVPGALAIVDANSGEITRTKKKPRTTSVVRG
jgi:hypothetical protein